MSGGGGKSGSEVEETSIPEWIKQPAIRNLQRAEDVQRIEYMPYRGPEVAGFTPSQISAFQNNLDTARAFGLAAPGSVMDGIPTPSTFAGGVSGYSTMPLYEEALAETTAAQPDAVAQYNALFGSNVGTTAKPNPSPNGIASLGGGGGNVTNTPTTPSTPSNFTPNYDVSSWSPDEQRKHNEEITATGDGSSTSILDAAYGNVTPNLSSRLDSKGYTPSYDDIAKEIREQQLSSRLDSKGYTPDYAFRGNPHMGK